MKSVRIASALLAILLVVGVVAVVSSQTNLLVTTRTDRFTAMTTSFVTVTSILNHTTTVSVYENVEMTGNCTAASYFLPDTVSAAPSTATFTSGKVTSYSVTYTTVYQNSTIGTETYSASTFVNDTITLVVTTTSTDPNYFPSDRWTATVCTFIPYPFL
jgi:hypothetical protein